MIILMGEGERQIAATEIFQLKDEEEEVSQLVSQLTRILCISSIAERCLGRIERRRPTTCAVQLPL